MSLTADFAPAHPDSVDDALKLVRAALDAPVSMASHIAGDDYTLVDASESLGMGLSPGVVFETSETFCHCVYDGGDAVVIPDVAEDDRVAGLPAHEHLGLESYIGVPLWKGGEFYGTLVVCDTEPRAFTDREIEHAEAAARLIEAML